MSKRKKKRRGPGFSPASMLRPRMDKLWTDDALLHKEDAAIEEDLDVLAKDVSSKLFVRTMLRSYQATSDAVQSRLDNVLPRWLAQGNYAETLKEITDGQSLEPNFHSLALTWLEATGVDTANLKKQSGLFLEAYYYDDEEIQMGGKSQAYVMVIWYTNPRKRRAQGMGFLLDYNPPWDGAVKDILVTPTRPPKNLLRDIVDLWEHGDMKPYPVNPERAKTVILTALGYNREADIRLPRDLIRASKLFERQVLSLPDEPDTPAYTMKDFDIQAKHGEYPDKIMNFEQNVGRRVRLESGDEVILIGAPWDDEDALI